MPPAIGYAIAGVAAGAGMFGAAKVQAKAAGRSAAIQTEAATTGADQALEAARAAERFQRQQAQATWADAETARKANYDQWAARQTTMNAFRKKYGFDPINIPAYVASADPRFVQPEPDAADRGAYQQYQQETPEAPLSPREWEEQFGGGLPAAVMPPPVPGNYRGPAPDSWRTRPVRRRREPIGDVGSYVEGGQATYQPYAPTVNPYAMMSVGDYLRRRR